MSITRQNPNTIFLGGDRTVVNDLATAAVVTPGMLVERAINAGVVRWKLPTADSAGPPAVANDQPYINKGVDDNYAIGDLLDVSILHKGGVAWMLVASGQTVAVGALLGAAADGTLKTGATVARFTALESKTAVALTRIRVEAL